MIHRPFNQSIIDGENFIKISETERLADEIYYYHYIQQFEAKNLFAEFRGDLSDGVNYALKLKNYNFNNFYENITNYNFDNCKSLEIILDKLQYLHSFSNYNCKTKDLGSNEKILVNKTENEFLKFIKKPNILMDHMSQNEFVIINNVKCFHFKKIWSSIKQIVLKNYLKFEISFIHGDFCFANILHNHKNNDLKFIDPRGSYHTRGCFGDKAYDYAKLLHSASGNYEQIIYDDYNLKIIDKNEVCYNFKHDFSELNSVIEKTLDPLLFEKSKLIEGLLFISMCSRHYENEEHQFIMYCQGLLILNKIYNESIQSLSPFTN